MPPGPTPASLCATSLAHPCTRCSLPCHGTLCLCSCVLTQLQLARTQACVPAYFLLIPSPSLPPPLSSPPPLRPSARPPFLTPHAWSSGVVATSQSILSQRQRRPFSSISRALSFCRVAPTTSSLLLSLPPFLPYVFPPSMFSPPTPAFNDCPVPSLFP